MVTFTNCSLARNTHDVTIKHVHSEKHSDVNRRVVAVLKVAFFGIGGRNCFKLYAVFWFIHQRIRRPIFIEINVYLGIAVNCRKFSTRKWPYLSPTVSRPSEGRAGWDTVGTGYPRTCCKNSTHIAVKVKLKGRYCPSEIRSKGISLVPCSFFLLWNGQLYLDFAFKVATSKVVHRSYLEHKNISHKYVSIICWRYETVL